MLPEDLHPPVWVLRMGHRPERDKRVTTHVALLSRAFGARGIDIDRRDEKLEGGIRSVVERFGGDFTVRSGVNPRKAIKGFDGKIVHLTMYGEPLKWRIDEIRENERILVVVGAEKVPGWVYKEADYNISITQQPHSEVSSLGVFLHHLYDGKEDELSFPGAKEVILPEGSGKRVIQISSPPLKKLEKRRGWLPTKDEALRILVDLGVPPQVIRHTIAVHDFAREICDRCESSEINCDLLLMGALLHDVGRAKTHGIEHGIKGAELLKKIGVDERLQRIAERHLGAGIKKEEAKRLGLPPQDYIPESIEEKLVAHLDNMIDDFRRVPLSHFVNRMEKIGLVDVGERALKLQEELERRLKVKFDDFL